MQLKLQKQLIETEVKAALIVDPVKSAKAVGLRYVSDTTPGIQRQQMGEEFCYISVDNKQISDKTELSRIKALVIPPAWTDIWICPLSHGHLQATGRDAKGRKQYRYHADWRKVRSQTKFNRLIAFGEALPKLRQQTQADLALPGLPYQKVLAMVVRLLEITRIRVGNEEYAQTNQSFGLTTMRDHHVKISGSKLQFKFRGKSGVQHEIELSDRRLTKLVKRCQDIPGQELFQYLDDDGQPQPIGSGDVNAYIEQITELDFTAKDFRTWAGTLLAAQTLNELGPFKSQTQEKKNVTQAIKEVAQQLGNRPATCRKYYVHPAIIDAYNDGSLFPAMTQPTTQKTGEESWDLSQEELALLKLLKHHLVAELQK
ncbi:MAG: DNA topoisomerase IB [Chroococcidiopsidaceae cyanobacterium CP_BM_RX_35]|nr:DNA topoisomerase IB [Chroococcidiopsidaceae cyanobacterium CP_BM_RX_35]